MSDKGKTFKGTYFISSLSLTSAMCEFGISAIFTLFLLYVMHFSMQLTSSTYAYYYGFAYLLPILIGYVSDKYLKKTTALSIGFVSMMLSQFILSFSASLYVPSNATYSSYFLSTQNVTFLIGMVFLALSSGFTNISITNLINSINDDDRTIDAFSIYYPIMNLGVMLGAIFMSVVVGNENYHLYKWCFLAFGILILISFIIFLIFKDRFLLDNNGDVLKEDPSKDAIKIESAKILNRITSISISEILNFNLKEKRNAFHKSLTKKEKDRLTVFIIFLIIIIFYRISYSQTSISLVFFIDGFVDRTVNDLELPVQLYFMLNPLFIMILGPIFIKFNQKMEAKNIELGFMRRTMLALLIIASCFFILAVIGYFLDMDHVSKINFIRIVVFELLIATSELFFSIAGYSLVGNLSPEKYYSLFFGLFLATRSISMYISGKLAVIFPGDITPRYLIFLPTNGLMNYFMMFVVLNVAAAAFLYLYRNRLKEKMHLEN